MRSTALLYPLSITTLKLNKAIPVSTTPTLAIFDLDNTLLAGDSDHAWGEFLIAQKLVDAAAFKIQNDQFYADYCAGTLDIDAYLSFALAPLAGKTCTELEPLHNQFMDSMIAPLRLKKADALLKKHKDSGDYLLIITATNSFITTPIAKSLGVDDIIASDAEVIDGKYSGKPTGIPCFQEGKVKRLKAWLANKPFSMNNAYFYSDSHNDIPLLEAVGHPVAVDADEKLLEYAAARHWPSISLRN